ncbi:MAG: hypothetical protein GVY18_08110 [Bacteroidetes bacterium]|jgi:polyhydroxyalkanoate synthesis repressor PhaR|nr:hypothetical protein [Bacteroidota bacterium]
MARLIKRYENRKLYDTEASAYVSLSDIADLVRQGETVEVIDNVTGDDLTAQTLTQIILEEGKQGKHVLPTDLLHDLLRRSGEVVDTSLERLRHGMDDLVQSSVGRLNQLVPESQRRSELRELRDQVNHLEGVLNDLLSDLEQKKQSGATNDAR